MNLNKTKEELKKDWEEAAELNNYRNTIAQGFTDEKAFKASGKSRTRALLSFIKEHDVSIKDKRIIEIGCGPGRMTEFLAKETDFIYAIDISMGMLKRFQERLGDIPNNVAPICAGDLSAIPSESVDVIVSYLVFQHIPEFMVETYLKDGYRVLKPGGHFVFQLTIKDKHEVIKSKTPATDMVRWTIKEVEHIINETNYEAVIPIGSLFNIWRKPE